MLLAILAGLIQTAAVVSDSTLRIPSAAVRLSATMTAPASGSPRAAAVLVSVAGPDDRDMSLGRLRILGDFATALAEVGIASIRYDDRGVGKSEGDWRQTSFPDRTGDVCAALQYLRTRFPAVPLGTIGMSEGGGLALRAAGQCGPAAFLVLLSTPVRPGPVELAAQVDRLVASAPVGDSVRAAFKVEAARLIRVVRAEPPAGGRDSVLAVLRGPFGPMLLPPFRFVPRDPEGQAAFLLSPWYRSQLDYDVGPDLRDVRAPVLAVYGGLDRNIDPAANDSVLRLALPGATIHRMTGLNHILQEARTGLPAEYATLPQGIAMPVVRVVVEWVLGQVGPKRAGPSS